MSYRSLLSRTPFVHASAFHPSHDEEVSAFFFVSSRATSSKALAESCFVTPKNRLEASKVNKIGDLQMNAHPNRTNTTISLYYVICAGATRGAMVTVKS